MIDRRGKVPDFCLTLWFRGTKEASTHFGMTKKASEVFFFLRVSSLC